MTKNSSEYQREYMRQWRKNNKDKIKKYRQKHANKHKEYNKQWKKINHEKCRIYHKKWKKENPEKWKIYEQRWKKLNPDKHREYELTYKSKTLKMWWPLLETHFGEIKCQTCGYNQCFASLEFHHRNPEEKENSISFLLNQRPKNKKIILKVLEEIQKCELLCANCHKEFHSLYICPLKEKFQPLISRSYFGEFDGQESEKPDTGE